MKTFKRIASLMLLTAVFINAYAEFGGAYLTFAGKFGGELTKQELKENSTLGIEGCAKGSEILKYTLEITSKGKTQLIQADNNQLSTTTIKLLRALDKGDSFIFKNMKAKLPTGGTVDVIGREFVVV